jgi:lipopolysaccharide transport system permease protein
MTADAALFQGAWRYRHYMFGAIGKEFRARFSRSRLGAAWSILNPLALVAIYAFVLSAVLSARLPGLDGRFSYAIYLTAGILAWTLFTDVVQRLTALFVDSGNVMEKVAFPRISLPIVTVGVALLDNLLLLLAILAVLALVGHVPGWHFLWLPLLLLVNLALAAGLGLALGIMNVFIRDISHVVPIVLQFGFWLTPIVYAAELVPSSLRPWLALNPLFPLVGAYQDAMVFDRSPDFAVLGAVAAAALLLLALGLAMLHRAMAAMVDAL